MQVLFVGRVQVPELYGEEERCRAHRLLCEKFIPTKMSLFDAAYRSGGARTYIYRIDIDRIAAKQKHYDRKP